MYYKFKMGIQQPEGCKAMKLRDITLKNGFLGRKHKLALDQIIPYQWAAINDEIEDAEPSHAIENFKIAAGRSSGEFHGMVFQDSDVAKWLEAAAYSLASREDETLKKEGFGND